MLGQRIDIQILASHFGVSIRTIQRDINERLDFLEWEETGPRFYKIKRDKFGLLNAEDIERFAHFASISNLFPKVDRTFYQEKLTESVQVKGFQYEDINHLDNEFKQLQKAIKTHQYIDFATRKAVKFSQNFTKLLRTVSPIKTAFGISLVLIAENKKHFVLLK